jgi:hypothetical protein
MTPGTGGEFAVVRIGRHLAASDWGLCKDCQWWQIELKASIANTTMGLCSEERLQPSCPNCRGLSAIGPRPSGASSRCCCVTW